MTPDAATVFEALSAAILVVGNDNAINMANGAAEHLLQVSQRGLVGQKLDEIIPPDSLVQTLVSQVWSTGSSIADRNIPLDTPRVSLAAVSVQVSPVFDPDSRDLIASIIAITTNTIAGVANNNHRHFCGF